MENYFKPETAANRYKLGRPYYHANTVAKIKEHLKITSPLGLAVDMACGTGLSTIVLPEIAKKIIGVDSSESMLNLAPQAKGISYVQGYAEKIPIPENMADIITVASGVHWFNTELFLMEATRVLKNEGWLVIYENYFTSKLIINHTGHNSAEFEQWFKNSYLQKFQTPKRNRYNWEDSSLKQFSFSVNHYDQFENIITFSKQELINYLITQSNVISNVENGNYEIEEVTEWLETELVGFFDTEKLDFVFGNWILYLRKNL